jgi:DNA-binding PadR family transcriptional regulator
MDFDDCPCSGKTLARLLQPAVMMVLAQEPLHGYRLVQRLGELVMFRAQSPDPTGVYRLLKAMEEQGYVTSAWELADSGPAKRRFALTRAGRACLTRWTQTLEVYEAAVADLLAASQRRPRAGRRRKRAARA